MDDVGMALVDWSEDVDDLIRCRGDEPACWLAGRPQFTNVHLLAPLADHRRSSSALPQGGAVVIPFPAARIGDRPAWP